MQLIVLGIGQSLRGDDAVGLEIVREWQKIYPETSGLVRVEMLELPGLDLIELLTGMDAAVIVDAVLDDQEPGKIRSFPITNLDSFDLGSRSAHGWGVAETFKLAESLFPEMEKIKILIIGISIKQVGVGAGISPEVRQAIPSACLMLEKKVQSLLT